MMPKRFKGFRKRQFLIENHTTYVVRENVVVCVISVRLPLFRLFKGFSMNQLSKLEKKHKGNTDYGYIELNKTFKGVSVCAAKDEFNESYGKKLAYSKAYLKAYKWAYKVYTTINKYFTEATAKSLFAADFIKSAFFREQDYLASQSAIKEICFL